MRDTDLYKYIEDDEIQKELKTISALSLIVHFGLYKDILNEEIFPEYVSIFRSMENKSALLWIKDNLPLSNKQTIFGEILNLYIQRRIYSNDKLYNLIDNLEIKEHLFDKLFSEIEKIIFNKKKADIKDILFFNDVSIRIGQYAHSCILMERIITKFPRNLYVGFANFLSPVKSQNIISLLWNNFKLK